MKIQTKWIEDLAVTEAKIQANAITTGKINADAVDKAKINADVAGNGLNQAAGGELDAKPDITSSDPNIAKAVNVDANGIAVGVDDSTLAEGASNRLKIKDGGVGSTQINENDTYDYSGGAVSVATPSSDAHAATKAYVDSVAQGLDVKESCLACADTNQTISGLPSDIDGVTTWSAGDRVLLTNQSTGSQNGIWEVQSGAWTRPNDFDTGDNAASAFTFIEQGTSYGDSGWVCTTDAPNDVIDTDSLAFVQFSGGGDVTAGVGLTKSGSTIDVGDGTIEARGGIDFQADDIAVEVDDSTLEIDTGVSEAVRIKDLGVSTGKIAATAVTAAKLGSDVAGDGLTGGNGSDLDVEPDIASASTTEANAIIVAANGVSVKVDDSTIEGSAQGAAIAESLRVKDDGITAAKVNADVAGEGILQEGSGALGLDINGLINTETTIDDTDLVAIYEQTDTRVEKITRANFLLGFSKQDVKQEMHLITAGEITAGYFTLASSPVLASNVFAWPTGGPAQVNKQAVGATGATPDFDILSTNQFHINNNGAATGLSEDFTVGDVIIIEYHIAA